MKTRRFLRICAFLLAFIFILAAFVGCKKKGNDEETTDTTVSTIQNDDGLVKDDLPETMDFGGRDVNILANLTFGFENYFSEGSSPDIIQNEIFYATTRVNERLNVNIKFVENLHVWDEIGLVYSRVCSDIMNDLCEYDIIIGRTYLPMFGGTELFYDLATAEYVNLDKPWYDQTMKSVWGEKVYGICAEGSLVNLKKMSCVFFNQQALEDIQITENLYDSVYEGTWTLEKMEQLIQNTYVSTDDIPSADDSFGVTFGDGNSFTPFAAAFNVKLYVRQNDGTYKYNAASSSNVNKMDNIRKFVNTNPNVLTSYNNESEDFKIDTAGQSGVSRIFADGRALFMFGKFENGGVIMSSDAINTKKIGVLPYPKYDTDQADYAATGFGESFYIPITVGDIGCASAVLEAWNSDFYRNVVPKYFETIVKARYSADNEMAEMFDFIRSKLSCSFESMFEEQTLLSMSTLTVKNCISGIYGLESWNVTAKRNEQVAALELNNIMKKYGIISE